MKNYFFYLSLMVAVLLFAGCKEEIPSAADLTDTTSENKRAISLTASMPGGEPEARIALEQDNQRNIILTWEDDDQIQLVFVQNGTVVGDKEIVTVKNISLPDRKSAAFDILVPEEITGGKFDLYGIYGGGGLDNTNPNLVIMPENPGQTGSLLDVQKSKDVMLYFSEKEIDYESPSANVTFQHLGSLFNISLQNTDTVALNNITGARLVGPDGGKWAYNFTGGGSYDLLTGEFQEITDKSGNYITFAPTESTLEGGSSIAFWGWVPPIHNIEWPQLTLELQGEGYTHTSMNVKDARTPSAGKAYYLYAEFDGTDLKFTSSGTPDEVELDKSLWSAANIPGDANKPSTGQGIYVRLEQLWNGWDPDNNDDRNYFIQSTDAGIPNHFTIDLGVKYILTRFRLNHLSHNVAWAFNNTSPKQYEIFVVKPGVTITDPQTDLQDNNNWVSLGSLESIKPSGSPRGTNTPEDLEKNHYGEEHDLLVLDEGTRYVRFKTIATWDPARTGMSALEFTFWGIPVE